MDDLERAEVLSSFVDYMATFDKPAFDLPDSWGRLNSAMVRALESWGLGSQGISFRTEPSNLSEIRVNYRLPDPRFVFGVGVDSAGAEISNAAWEELPRILPAVERALAAVRETLNVQIARQTITLAIHIKSASRSCFEILRDFVKPGRIVPPGERPTDYSFTIQTDGGSYSLEPSLRVAGALYIGVGRRYPGDTPVAKIAQETRQAEDSLLNVLGFTIDENVPTTK